MRRLNPHLAKIHRNYSVEDIADLFGVHKNTVRRWINQGLPTIDDRRPILVLGRDLREFLRARRARNKRPCRLGEFYCFRCRVPRRPAGEMADYEPTTLTSGNLVGICPSCGILIFRRTSLTKLEQIRAQLDITIQKAPRR